MEVEVGLFFGAYDVLMGGKAMFEGVLGDDGFAVGGAWAGGFLGVKSICEDLRLGSHNLTSEFVIKYSVYVSLIGIILYLMLDVK